MSGVVLWLGVGVLGGAGALARFLLDGFIAARAKSRFPLGTLAVNLSGALLLGLVAGLALHGDALLLAGTAVLGSYTTFSTWMMETERLAEKGDDRLALANVAVSLAGGLGAIVAGWALGAAL